MGSGGCVLITQISIRLVLKTPSRCRASTRLLTPQLGVICCHSSMHAYSGYHQLFMKKEDEEKTAFITPRGTYCFIRMPFRLKSAGSTFARAVQIGFEPQLHRNMEAYMDDIVVKTKDRATLISDLWETFANLHKIKLKLNPEKCVFG